MAEQQESTHKHVLSFEKRVLEKIANYTVPHIDGILELKSDYTSGIKSFFSSTGDDTSGVKAEVGEKEVALDLDVIAEYGKNIPAAFQNVTDILTRDIAAMTGLKVVEVNMNISDVMTRSEHEQSKKNSDRGNKAESDAGYNYQADTDRPRVQ